MPESNSNTSTSTNPTPIATPGSTSDKTQNQVAPTGGKIVNVNSKMPPNPYYAFVKFIVGENDYMLMPPMHEVSFSYVRKPLNAANKFQLDLFDDTAIMVEYQLMKGYKEVNFQYGYVGGDVSPIYSGTITSYDVDFSAVGAILHITGLSSSVGSFAKPTTKTYTNMTIDQIVKDIAKEEKWEIGHIIACKPVADGDHANKTFTRNNQVAQKFITNELIPLAKSAETGDSNYVLNFSDKDGKTTVNFYPMIQASKFEKSETHQYEFTWGAGNKDSKVISFNPEYSGTLKLVTGGATVDAKTVDKIANEMFSVKHDNTTDKNRTVLDDKGAYDFKAAKRVIGGSAYTQDEMKHIAAYMWYSQATYPVTASLSILGDPNIQAFDMIDMIMLNKDGIPHHSSGAYLIKEVTDDIQGGNFTTTLQMFRNAMKIGIDKAGGINITMDSTYPATSTTGLGDNHGAVGGASNSKIINIAMQHKGEGGSIFQEAAGIGGAAWCAAFVCWCAEQAGCPNPHEVDCDRLRQYFIKKGTWHGISSGYKPVAGDCIIYGYDTDSGTQHTGLVVRSDGNNIYTIEGNWSNRVCEKTITYDGDGSNPIAGFGQL